ncbi:MAG: T9SS type A sorting domain-containing protein [Bacteroidia bacterium]|nr:T9SS type A sorting domain-containing protein [Bacteroidia bacterium]
MKYKVLLFLFFVLGLSYCFAQKTGSIYLPPQSPQTPEWFNVFYETPDFTTLNVKELDQKAEIYAQKLKLTQKEERQEIQTGEENEDAWLNFYRRWRREADHYLQPDGTIRIPEQEAFTHKSAAPGNPAPMSPSSVWNLIGPVQTFWSASNNPTPWQVNIYAMAVSATNPNILFACPETGGIFKTTDKGLNWIAQTADYNIRTCSAIEIHPSNPDTVCAGRSNQLFMTHDGGTTWITSGLPSGNIHKIAFHPANPHKIIVASDNGLFANVPAGTPISAGSIFNVASLTTTSPKWNRNAGSNTTCSSSPGTNQYYHVFPFTVSVSGSYTFSMCTPTGNWDAHASLFQNAFNGSNPCAVPANHLVSDDDANSGGNCNDDPMMTTTLNTGVTYYLVSTSFNNNVTGNFQWTFTGPLGAVLSPANESWIQIPGMTTSCTDLFFKTNDPNIVFCLKKVAGFTEFWRSVDGGNSFSPSLSGWTGKGITSDGGGRMTVTPANPDRIYAVLLGSTPSPDKPYIFRSNDAGLTWDTTATGRTGSPFFCCATGYNLGLGNGQGFYDLDILVNPLNADDVIVGTTTAFRSSNGGVSFSVLGGYMGSFGIHPDIQDMIAIGGDSWITTDGGINYSSDFFNNIANFTPRFKGIYSSDMWGFAQGWNEDIVGGGRYHNGNTAMSETYPYGEAIRLGGGEAATGYYMVGRPRHIAFSDITPKVVPVTRNGASGSFGFTRYPNEDGYGNDMSEVEFLPYCYNHLYVGSGNELWKSTNGGISWTSLYTFAGRVKEFEISRTNPDIIYLATNTPTQLQKSTDGGLTWTVLPLPAGASINRVSLALSFTDENKLWMVSPSNTSNNRVFKTTDGGLTWTNMTTATINAQAYTAIVHAQGTDNGVYILGDNAAVYYKSDSEPDWVIFNSNLPKVHNNEHIKPFYRDSKIRSAGNQGIWQVDFYEEGTPVAQPTVDKLTTTCPRDTFYFEDYSALNHSGATWAWTFSGTSYVSSTSVRNPKVLFSGAGTYDFSLTVSNGMGSSSKTVSGKISITGNECAVDTIPGKMLTLTAAGDYAQQNAAMNITTNNLTLSAWIKPDGTQMTNAGILFSGSGGASGLNFRAGNQLGYHWEGLASTYNWSGGPTAPANEWSHVALVIKDGPGTSDTAVVYLNGVPYSRTGTHNPVLFSTVFQFGIDRGNTSRNFIGSMDEVCIYNRALSRNEIRELMNLTRNNPNPGSMPSQDISLIHYYQFNESITAPVYDKVGSRHLTFAGNASKSQLSSAPVGGGNFQRMMVNTGGVKNFVTPGLSLTFPLAGVYPNGDLVVTRLHVPSDQPCASNVLPNPAGYWIVRNYGTNATFSPLTELQFLNASGTTPAMIVSPSDVTLYKRASNADGATWGTVLDSADAATDSGGYGNITFNAGLSLTGFSQFSMGVATTPLSVSLLHFTAALTADETAKLQWESIAELNFAGYEIQHSTDGTVFNKIGYTQGNGGGKYSFLHPDVVSGKNYYRLKMLDNDGSYRFSNKEVLYRQGEYSCTIYPNPSVDGWFNLDLLSSNTGNVLLTFSNSAGQTVTSFSTENRKGLNKHRFYLPFSPGIYFLKITAADGQIFREKIVIE